MEAELAAYVEDKYLNGIRQHDPEWHRDKKYTIGGSTIKDFMVNSTAAQRRFVCGKLGITPSCGSIQMHAGTLFEEPIQIITEHKFKTQIQGTLLYVHGENRNTAYSPDGLCVLNVDGKWQHVLVEFKCPWSRSLNGSMPKMYLPQVLMGLQIISIATMGMFVEGAFRRCTWDQLAFNPDYDTTQPHAEYTQPIALGFCGMYISRAHLKATLEKLTADDLANKTTEAVNLHNRVNYMMAEYTETYGPYGTKQSDFVCNDLGLAYRPLLEKILALFDKKIIQVKYSDVIYPGESIEKINTSLDAFVDECKTNNHILIGVYPWKLFRLDHYFVQPVKDFLTPYYKKIDETIEIIKKCEAVEPDKRMEIINEYFGAVAFTDD